MQQDIIGLIPAGGSATRLAPLPLSKELYPIGWQPLADGTQRPKVVGQYLLEKMRKGGITKAFWILRPGKWDIPAYFGDGTQLDMHLGYLTVHVPHGVPYTLDQAFPFVADKWVALGFPDILFQPDDAFVKLRKQQAKSGADVVLGLFPTEQFWKAGMVEFDPTGRVLRIVEKPQESDLQYMWAIALWTPQFSQFLHDFLKSHLLKSGQELPIGDVIQAAIASGLIVDSVAFPDGTYLDVGTPEDLQRAIREVAE
jgi:glucose-1-phosphate thymidylyltransferase